MVRSICVFPQKRMLGPENSVGLLETKIYSEDELLLRRPTKEIFSFCNETGKHELNVFSYKGNLGDELNRSLITKEKAMQMLEAMLFGRELEKMSVKLKYKTFGNRYGNLTLRDFGELTFPTHLAIGQEAMSVGSIFAIDPKDYITSTHRGHVDAFVKGYRFINAMSDEERAKYVQQNKDIANKIGFRQDPLQLALDIHLEKTIAELFGKKDGYCKGKGGGQHLTWHDANNLGNDGIVGGMLGIGAGSGIASKILRDKRITLAIAGDGGFVNENAYGAVSMATMSQFRNGLMSTKDGPKVVFVCYNNHYAMTCQQFEEVTSNKYLSQRFVGFNPEGLHAETIFGMDVMAVYDGIRNAKEIIEQGKGPVFRELMGYRFFGHSLSDDALNFSGKGRETYRTIEEILEWKNYDPVSLFASQIICASLMSVNEFRTLENQIEKRVQRSAKIALESDFPSTSEMFDGLYTNTTSDKVPTVFANSKSPGPKLVFARDKQGRIDYSQAVREAIAQEMRRDKRVLLFGEDIAQYGGAFGETSGLWEEFDFDRVFNTCLCEANISGMAIGMALRGLRPIAKASMYIDFLTLASDQILNHAAKLPYMSGGQLKVPAVFWTDIGGGMGYAGQHSQSLEALFYMPGIKIVAPATAYDAKGLMISCIKDDNPTIYIGHQNLYKNIKCDAKAVVHEEPYTIPIGVANVIRKVEKPDSKAVTLISYSWMLYNTLKASEMLKKEGYQSEVIDLRTLLPLDTKTIYESIKKTGRAVIAHQATVEGGLGQMLAGKIISEQLSKKDGDMIDYLEAPIRIVGAPFCVPPCALTLEKSFTRSDGTRNRGFIPGRYEIYKAAKEILI